MRKDWGKC